MTVTGIAAAISTLLAIYCGYPYLKAILRGKTKPHRLSWLIFTVMNGMVFFAQYLAGGRISTLISLTFFIYSLIIFVLSFRYGISKASKADWYLFTFAILAMIAWIITKSNDLAIWLTLLIDLAASAMIVLKEKNQPGTEDAYPWALGTAAYVFSCITLIDVNPGILYVRPIYGLICDAAIVVAIYYFSRQSHIKKKHIGEILIK
jgi:hypothetical protein